MANNEFINCMLISVLKWTSLKIRALKLIKDLNSRKYNERLKFF